jgi:thiamine-monophosphate kinase
MPSPKTERLSELGELGLVRRFRTRCISSSPEVLKGIGDDAAAVKIKAGITLITTDMLLEGVHFDLSLTTFFQLGYKALAVNISDILAMGGKPEYFLLCLGIPKTCRSTDIDALYSGMMKIAKKFRVSVIGGDTSASRKGLVLSGTLIGNADRIITRSGARPRDGIFVTNTLGDSAMGLLLLRKLSKKTKHISLPTSHLKLIRRHLMPEPRPLKKTSGITSMIDVSDGLLMDLSHICDESKVGAVIYKDKIPLSRGLASAAKNTQTSPLKYALKGGEDYVLLFTARPDIKTNAFRIGEITRKGRFLVGAEGRKTPFKAEGYEHFK